MKKKHHLSRKTKEKLSKALKKYWKSFEGRQRRHQFFQIPAGGAKAFREKEKSFRSKERGEYDIRLLERQSKGGYKGIDISQFKKNHSYLVYIVHRATRRSRLLASGRLKELPIASLKRTQHLFSPVIGTSRKFNPLPLKKVGKWLPISRFYNRALKNIESQQSELQKEGQNYKIRGAILPLKRYYNPDLMIFSDQPVPRDRMIKEVFAHVVTAYDYPGIRWISARHVKVEFKRGIRADKLKDKLEQIEDLATEALAFEHPKAGVKALMVDGFIPVKYSVESKKKKRRK